MEKAFNEYLKAISDNLKAGNATEHTHRPALKTLLQSLNKGITATNEPKQVECGAPDFVVSQKASHGLLTVGHVEAKDVGRTLGDIEKSEQLKRYRRHLGNLVLTDYLEFRWYVDGEKRLKARLGFARDDGKVQQDKSEWGKVFELLESFLSHAPAPISKPKELAVRMAGLTHMVRDIVVRTLDKGKSSSLLKDLRTVFAKRLIPDIDKPEKGSQFADMYAQTITYGLFAARCNHNGPERFKRIGAAAEIPKTNPFLRSMLGALTGPELDDEPYVGFVNDIADLLADADIEEIVSEFGKRTGRQDPVLHFYETFLAAYDPKLRERRGVYYTPEPVVSYIVRSVDHILKTRFGCAEGLADKSEIEYERKVKKSGKIETVKAKSQKVLILDPACGTGTFLYSVVDHIREQFRQRGDAGMWPGYVKNHLLPRLFGFELLMAPYAVAHFKLGMQLAAQDMPELMRDKWAYDFSSDERLGIYLTNTLETAEKISQEQFQFLERKVVDEANAAAEIKRDLPIMVILGNPPYSGVSSNMGQWIDGLLKGKFPGGEKGVSYYEVDGKPLGEKKTWLQDDYVKFIRWAQWRIEHTGAGVLGFITNHAYLDNPTFRGMRQQLIKNFNEIYIIDLHGNSKKKETCPDGSKDENVFDIQQGVAIGIFVKEKDNENPAKVHHADLWGLRKTKYEWLFEQGIDNTKMQKLTPNTPFYFFVPRDETRRKEYEPYQQITNIMHENTTGIVTARDGFVFDLDEANLVGRISEFRSDSISDDQIRSQYFQGKGAAKYPQGDTRGWKLPEARKKVREDKDWKKRTVDCLYRPFDVRPLYYVPWMVDWPRPEVMRHMLGKENIAFHTCRQIVSKEWQHVLATNGVTDDCYVSNKTRERGYTFPLYLYPDPEKPLADKIEIWPRGKDGRVPNLDKGFVEEFAGKVGLEFVSDGRGDLKKTFGPEDIFDYIYAVFHSPTYRERYKEFLKIDFPRVPITSDVKLFRNLVSLGGELVSLHLLESPKVEEFITTFPERGDNIVDKRYPRYSKKRGYVEINKNQYFYGIPNNVWEFQVGGYQVCRKWLKDRKGRKLTFDDLEHYQKVVVALSDTIRIMAEIDKSIPSWPIK